MMKTNYRQPEMSRQNIFSEEDGALIDLIQTGLPLSSTPYADLGNKIGMTEDQVIARLTYLHESNIIKRIGVVVRHHELGYRANAMTVWDIEDDIISELGATIGKFDFVTLCYSRPRRLPHWPYNLFTMIHGKNRDNVLSNIEILVDQCGLETINHDVLFSTRRFKQRGAIYRK